MNASSFSHDGSKPVTSTAWCEMIPELRTRPLLLAYLESNPRRRRQFFALVEDVISVAGRMVRHRRGAQLVEFSYHAARSNLASWWSDLDYGRTESSTASDSHRVFNQAVGCLRNVYLNGLNRVAETVKHRPESPFFVLREPVVTQTRSVGET